MLLTDVRRGESSSKPNDDIYVSRVGRAKAFEIYVGKKYSNKDLRRGAMRLEKRSSDSRSTVAPGCGEAAARVKIRLRT